MQRIRSSSIQRSLVAGNLLRHFSSHIGSKLEGKVALITGAASGIGKETASKFINNGAKVVIADIQHDVGHQLVAQLGPSASFFPCNVTNEADVSNAVDFAVSKYGQLDILYANAGVACRTKPSIVDLDLATFDRVMAINVRGAVAAIKHASRVMIPRKSGSILCTASVTGLLGGMAQHTYTISKTTIIAIVKSLAAELCHHGIRVNCISPFAISTPMTMNELQEWFLGVEADRIVEMVRSSGVLQGAYCEPSDIANAALYLASDDAKYVSGHNLVVDGGFTTMKAIPFVMPEKKE